MERVGVQEKYSESWHCLCKTFSEKETLLALIEGVDDKVPDPDGFPMGF